MKRVIEAVIDGRFKRMAKPGRCQTIDTLFIVFVTAASISWAVIKYTERKWFVLILFGIVVLAASALLVAIMMPVMLLLDLSQLLYCTFRLAVLRLSRRS